VWVDISGVEDAPAPRRQLGRILVEKGVLSEFQLHHALAFQRLDGRPLGEILLELGLISPADLERALAERSVVGPPIQIANREVRELEKGERELARREQEVTSFLHRQREEVEQRERLLEAAEAALAERERRVEARERELAAYVTDVQAELCRREAESHPPPATPVTGENDDQPPARQRASEAFLPSGFRLASAGRA
jgi:uncharacterized protein YhaN